MTTSPVGDAPISAGDHKVVLRIDVLDALMASKDVQKKDHARRFGISRQHYSALRHGHKAASLPTAMAIAAAAGTSVEVIFERVA